MADARYVARRTSDRIERDFPARPTLPAGTPCDGLAFVARLMPLADLRPLREHIRAMWRGPIAPQPGAPPILVVAFDRAVVIDEAWPGALPLVAADGFAWRSFVPEGPTPRLRSATARPGPRWIDLWWNGTRQRVAVDALDPLPIAGFWDIPMLEVHPPAPRMGRSPGVGGAARGGGGATPGDGDEREVAGGVKATSGLSRVSTTPVPIDSIKGKSLAGMTNALEQRRDKFTLGGLLASLFRPLGSASGGEQAASVGSSDGRPGTPRPPGTLASLIGWLKWCCQSNANSSLDDGLRSLSAAA